MIQQVIPDEILEECNKCKGIGKILGNDKRYGGWEMTCPRCFGSGKTDWVSNVTGSNDDRWVLGASGMSGYTGVSGVQGMPGISGISGYSVGYSSYVSSPPITQPNPITPITVPTPVIKPIKNSKPLKHKLIELINNTLG